MLMLCWYRAQAATHKSFHASRAAVANPTYQSGKTGAVGGRGLVGAAGPGKPLSSTTSLPGPSRGAVAENEYLAPTPFLDDSYLAPVTVPHTYHQFGFGEMDGVYEDAGLGTLPGAAGYLEVDGEKEETPSDGMYAMAAAAPQNENQYALATPTAVLGTPEGSPSDGMYAMAAAAPQSENQYALATPTDTTDKAATDGMYDMAASHDSAPRENQYEMATPTTMLDKTANPNAATRKGKSSFVLVKPLKNPGDRDVLDL
jgi:hypothetical protein